jgi:hypothetical protein
VYKDRIKHVIQKLERSGLDEKQKSLFTELDTLDEVLAINDMILNNPTLH